MTTAAAPLSRCAPHLRTLLDLGEDRVRTVLRAALQMKRNPQAFSQALAGKAIVMLFEKPSLRTRVSFEVGMARLGGAAVYLDHTQDRIGMRESVSDYARNLERWADAVVARTYSHRTIEALASASSAPVVNALSDHCHPCQALADCLTLLERFGPLEGLPLTFVGDGNNVCVSLLRAGALLGMRLTVCCPPGYEPPSAVVAEAQELAAARNGAVRITHDPLQAVQGAKAVYTDVWTSMGQTEQAQQRRADFAPYQVTTRLMAQAAPDAVFMHCLPAHRGEEVEAAVIDSAQSVVYDQAENRMHAQNALLTLLLRPEALPEEAMRHVDR